MKLWLLCFLPTIIICQTFNYTSTFPKNKLYSLKPDSIGLDKVDGTIAAFGDFNGDKLYTQLALLFLLNSHISIVQTCLS